ncbi:NTPase, partial [Streptococcus pyogenes]
YPRYNRNKPYDKNDLDQIFEFWNPVLELRNLDISEKLYLLEKHYVFSFHELGRLFSDLTLTSDSFRSLKRKDFYLSTYLSSHDLWNNYSEWSPDIWRAVGQLNDHE